MILRVVFLNCCLGSEALSVSALRSYSSYLSYSARITGKNTFMKKFINNSLTKIISYTHKLGKVNGNMMCVVLEYFLGSKKAFDLIQRYLILDVNH